MALSIYHAVAPADYTSMSAEVLTFPVGSANGDMQCRNITIIDDHSLEPPENFTVTISNLLYSGEDATIDSPSTAVVNVEDSAGMRQHKEIIFQQEAIYILYRTSSIKHHACIGRLTWRY